MTLTWTKVTGAKSYTVQTVSSYGASSTYTTAVTRVFSGLPEGEVTFTVTGCSDKYGKKPIADTAHSITVTVGDWSWASPFVTSPALTVTQPSADEAVVLVTACLKEGWDAADCAGFELLQGTTVLASCANSELTFVPAGDGESYGCRLQLWATLSVGKHSALNLRPYRLAKDGSHIVGSSYYKKSTLAFTVKGQAWMSVKLTFSEVCQLGEDTVSLSWNDIWDTDEDDTLHGYAVYEVLKSGVRQVYSGREASCEIADVTYGKHTYRVQAWHLNSIGGLDVGSFSKDKAITTKAMWSQAAASVTAVQTSDTEPLARVTWTTVTGWNPTLCDGFEISCKIGSAKKYTHLDFVPMSELTMLAPDAATGRCTLSRDIALPGVAKYSIYVRPYKFNSEGDPDDVEGSLTYGAWQSKAASLNLKVGWMTAVPTLTAKQTDEHDVLLTWSENAVANAYEVWEVMGKNKADVLIATVTDGLSLQLTDIAYGAHTYRVLPTLTTEAGAHYEGTTSKSVSLTTAVLWSQAPSVSWLQLGEDSIRLSWTVKQQSTYAIHYKVYAKTGKVTTEIADTGALELTVDADVYPLKIGTAYTFTVVPYNEETKGTSSKALSVKLIDTWMVAPVVTLQQTNTDEVTVSWTTLAEADSYVLHFVKSKKDTKTTVTADAARLDDCSFSYTVSGLAAGTWSVQVEPVKKVNKKNTSGTRSKAQSITLAAYDAISDAADDFIWGLNEDGETVPITGYIGSSAVVVIPDIIKGHTVTAIDEWAFGNKSLRQVTVPSTVITIGDSAFAYSSLRTVRIPASVTALGDCAFTGCEQLTSVVLGSGITAIPQSLFYDCEELTTVTLPAGITAIGENAFHGTKLSTVNFKGKKAQWKAVSIGMGNAILQYAATIVCSDGTIKPTYGGKLSDTVSWSFSGTTLTISGKGDMPEGVYDFIYQTVSDLYEDSYSTHTPTLDVVIGSGITSVSAEAFYGCHIRSVSLPATLTSIGEQAFRWSTLSEVTIPNSVTEIGESAFDSEVYLYVYPGSAGEAFAIANGNPYEIISKLTINTTTLSVRQHATAFLTVTSNPSVGLVWSSSDESIVKVVNTSDSGEYCTLEGVSMGTATVTATVAGGRTSVSCTVNVADGRGVSYSWEANADGDDTVTITDVVLNGATVVDFPASINGHTVTRIELDQWDASSNCTKVTSMSVPDTVTYIGEGCFQGWGGLRTVSLPAGLQTVDDEAFARLTNIKTVTYRGTMAQWKEINIYSNNLPLLCLADIVCTDGTIAATNGGRIGDTAFTWSYAGSTLTISGSGALPDETNAFMYYVASGLGDFLYYVSSGLSFSRLVLSEGITDIPGDCFYSMSNITSVSLPSTLKTIGAYAFEGTGLTSVTIPAGVTSIGEYAFDCCPLANGITYEGTQAQWNALIGEDRDDFDGIAVHCSDGDIGTEPALSGTTAGGIAWSVDPDTATITVSVSGTYDDGDDDGDSEIHDICGDFHIRKVIFSEGITAIDYFTYDYITEAVFPSSLQSIGSGAFSYSHLGTLSLSNVATIGESAFNGCDRLTSVTLYNVSSIEDYAFDGCTGLTSVVIRNDTSVPLTLGDSAFRRCAMTHVELSAPLTAIPDECFYDCGSLTGIVLPATLKTIGDGAFWATTLSSVLFRGTKAQWNAVSVGDDNEQLTYCATVSCSNGTVQPPTSGKLSSKVSWSVSGTTLTLSGTGALPEDSDMTTLLDFLGIQKVVIGKGITAIPYGCFGWSSITAVSLPSTLKTIGEDAFCGSYLTSVTIPNSVTSIGSGAFMECEQLESASIGTGIKTLPSGLFAYSGLKKLTLPATVTKIQANALDGTALTAVTYAGTVAAWKKITVEEGNNVLKYGVTVTCSNGTITPVTSGQLGTVDWAVDGGTMTFSGSGALPADGSVAELVDGHAPSTVVVTGDVTLPANFIRYCQSVKRVELTGTLTTLPEQAFYECESLQSVTIPEGVTSLGTECFGWCMDLTTLTIPDSVTSIGTACFYGCMDLTVRCHSGSYAETYCQDNAIPYILAD